MSTADTRATTGRRARAAVWLPGLAVAVGAAVATAHGLFEVAVAARVPAGLAWIYPLITDGLALVAYAATARLSGSAARYAWSVVILSAGLSGLAQASYLSSDAVALGGGLTVSPALRFGVGAWPAIAAAVVAHLLYLLAADRGPVREHGGSDAGGVRVEVGVRPSGATPPDTPAGLDTGRRPRSVLDGPVITPPEDALSDRTGTADPAFVGPRTPSAADRSGAPLPAEAPARDRACDAARRHRTRHGVLPTVRELQALADVGRGTAADALKQLRDDPPRTSTGLRLIADDTDTRTHS